MVSDDIFAEIAWSFKNVFFVCVCVLRILLTENELRYEKMEKFYGEIKQKSFPNTVDVTFDEIKNNHLSI